MKSLSQRQITIILGAVGVIVLIVILFSGIIPGFRKKNPADNFKGTITVMGTGEKDSFESLIAAYRTERPLVSVDYMNVEGNYEANLVNSLAAGQGPDVLMFHRSWLNKHGDKIYPAPSETFSGETFRSVFPKIAAADFLNGNTVFAAPLYIDTLAMFYNRDLFDAKSVALAPSDWSELEKVALHMRTVDANGELTSPGAAIGGNSESIRRAFDILGLFIMQFGGKIPPIGSGIRFGDAEVNGLSAYTRFADPKSDAYVWDKKFGDSLNSFANEEVPIMFDYRPAEKELAQKNPNLNYVITPMIQADPNRVVNYADYWGLAVSNQSANKELAWDFISFAAKTETGSQAFLSPSLHSPALRTLIQKLVGQKGPEGIFAQQALTANAWQGYDLDNTKTVFDSVIQLILDNKGSAENAVDQAENQLR